MHGAKDYEPTVYADTSVTPIMFEFCGPDYDVNPEFSIEDLREILAVAERLHGDLVYIPRRIK